MAILFAATHPDRVSGLALVNTYARNLSDHDYPMGFDPDDFDSFVEMTRNGWGSIDFARLAVPSRADDVEYLESVAMSMRSSATPRNAAAQYAHFARSIDARHVLPLVQAPTLVLHARETPWPLWRLVATSPRTSQERGLSSFLVPTRR
jgi:pimeloyl-ACP methyl ester carboxylesterase